MCPWTDYQYKLFFGVGHFTAIWLRFGCSGGNYFGMLMGGFLFANILSMREPQTRVEYADHNPSNPSNISSKRYNTY